MILVEFSWGGYVQVIKLTKDYKNFTTENPQKSTHPSKHIRFHDCLYFPILYLENINTVWSTLKSAFFKFPKSPHSC